jgi:hypothetical protein
MNSCAWIRPCALDGVRWCSACGLWQLQFEVHSAGARLQGVAGGHKMKLFYWWDVNLFRLLGCQDARRRQLSFFKKSFVQLWKLPCFCLSRHPLLRSVVIMAAGMGGDFCTYIPAGWVFFYGGVVFL